MNLSGYRRTQSRVFVLLIICMTFGLFYLFACSSAPVENTVMQETPDSKAEVEQQFQVSEDPGGKDYSQFQHSNPQHARLPCLLCHKREDNSAAPKLSGHLPCAGCHVQQFADNDHQICSICHTSEGLKRFPGLKSFDVRFDHATHLRQTNCATCHKSSRRGVAFSIPSGLRAHNTCFTCHSPDAEIGDKKIGSCDTCHQPGRPPVQNSEWARAYAANFSHADHTKRNDCAACHTVRARMPRGRQVSSPLVSMHFPPAGVASCGNCHNDKRAFGGNDFSDCKRCHEGGSFKF